jgi:hypothetical protein
MIGPVKLISKLLYRLLTLLLAIPISRAIKKLIAHGWTAVRPEDPPRDPKKADVGWSDALIWAVISGAGTALGKLLTSKGAAGTWRAIIGTEPPGFEKDPAKQAAI